MAGPIMMIFYVVKVWTLRFCIKYSSIGYMPICGVNNGATFGHWKKVIFGVSRKFASFKRQFLREAVVDSNTNCMHSLHLAMTWPMIWQWEAGERSPHSICQCRSALRASAKAQCQHRVCDRLTESQKSERRNRLWSVVKSWKSHRLSMAME